MDERLRPFDYMLPPDRIARHPPADRDGGRLLVLSEGIADQRIPALVELVRPGDLLVINDTRVLHARMGARRKSGGRVELLAMPDPARPDQLLAMARPARRLRPGETLDLCESLDEGASSVPGLQAVLGGRRDDGTFEVELHPDPDTVMGRLGMVPIPPYLSRPPVPADSVRYQTVYSGASGAVAAPTAGLHFSLPMLEEIERRGCRIAHLTLHVGPGTFRKLRPEDLDRGTLHEERYYVPESTSKAVARTRASGGRVIAVGTTSTRTLESAVREDGTIQVGWGCTRLFIRPGFRFRVVDRLWTNLHLPGSSLLMLVCAFGGTKRVMDAYAHAVAEGYRFYSYGDAMFIHPTEDAPGSGG